jgi:Tfp pilus assembly protein PilN
MQNINLLEPRVSRDHPNRALRRALLCIALLATLAFAAGVLESRVLEQTRSELAHVVAENERLSREQSSLAAPSAALLEELARDEGSVAAIENVAQLLASGNLGHTHGFTEDLRAFGRAIAPGIWYTNMRIDNASDSMTLEGRTIDASRVPVLIHALQAEPHFTGARFSSIDLRPDDADSATGTHALAFRIATPVDAANPAVATTKAGGAQ